MKFENEIVNAIVSTKDVSSKLLSLIEDKTKDYYSHAQFDRKNVKEFGLQVYKDYYTCLAVVYKGANKDTRWTSIGNFMNMGTDNMYLDLGGYDKESITKEVRELLKDNYTISYNPELEELEDAIASGDYEWVDSIVGDRDLAELI